LRPVCSMPRGLGGAEPLGGLRSAICGISEDSLSLHALTVPSSTPTSPALIHRDSLDPPDPYQVIGARVGQGDQVAVLDGLSRSTARPWCARCRRTDESLQREAPARGGARRKKSGRSGTTRGGIAYSLPIVNV
jgi:hypothetical protein